MRPNENAGISSTELVEMKKMFRVEERPLFPHHSVPPNPSTHLQPDYTKKVQCNYNNIIAFHQSTVTCTGTWSCIGWARCWTLSLQLHEGPGMGMQNCSTFLLPIFQESYTYCAHASCRICGPRGRFLFVGDNAAEFKKTRHEDNTQCLPNTCVGKENTLQ